MILLCACVHARLIVRALQVNADHYSAWNVRKKLLLAGLSTVQNELRFVKFRLLSDG